MVESERKHEAEIPSLEEIISRAHDNFRQTRCYISEYGKVEGYGTFEASNEAVKEVDADVTFLAVHLSRQTQHTPNELQLLDWISEEQTWELLFEGIATYIVEQELADRYPDLREASLRRKAEFDSL